MELESWQKYQNLINMNNFYPEIHISKIQIAGIQIIEIQIAEQLLSLFWGKVRSFWNRLLFPVKARRFPFGLVQTKSEFLLSEFQ